MTKKTSDTALNCSESGKINEEQRRPSKDKSEHPSHVAQNAVAPRHDLPATPAQENGGQKGPDPTRYGDWEKKGRCTDF